MGPGGGSEHVIGGFNIRDPVSKRLIDRVFKRARTVRYGHHLSPKQPHARHVKRLTFRVFLAHVDNTLETKERRRSRGCNTVLARPRLSNDPFFADPLRQQSLTPHVADFVRSRAVELLALSEDARAASVLRETRHL